MTRRLGGPSLSLEGGGERPQAPGWRANDPGNYRTWPCLRLVLAPFWPGYVSPGTIGGRRLKCFICTIGKNNVVARLTKKLNTCATNGCQKKKEKKRGKKKGKGKKREEKKEKRKKNSYRNRSSIDRGIECSHQGALKKRILRRHNAPCSGAQKVLCLNLPAQ